MREGEGLGEGLEETSVAYGEAITGVPRGSLW